MSLFEDFTLAIERGDSSKVKSLISRDSIDVNARLPRDKRPPALVFAAHLGCKDVVDVLLRAGAHINDVDDMQRTACHAVAWFDRGDVHVAVLELLLAHRPNLDLKCKRGRTPLEDSFKSSDSDLGRISIMLIEAGAPLERVDSGRLCRFAAQSTLAIQTLIRRGVAINELYDGDFLTPLHLAVTHRTAEALAVINMLVNECGADLEARSVDGETCTHIAMLSDNADAIRLLIASGANVAAVDDVKCTPLNLLGDAKCATLLLAAGADVHTRSESGRTPLLTNVIFIKDVAMLRSMVNVMLAGGADLDAADLDGSTARQRLADSPNHWHFNAQEVETARRDIAKVRLDFVRHRAWQVCIGLQSRGLDALQTCEILVHACGPVAPLIPFHQWWKLATTVKHFKTI
jgi:ankyrin repeat protein